MTEPSHSTLELDRKAGSALLALVARKGWHAVSVGAVAREAGLKLDQVWFRSPGRVAILARYAAAIDAAVLEGTVPAAPGESIRDRLFDLVMRRFDLLLGDRAGLAALPRELVTDPFSALAMAPVGLRSMSALLEAAGVSAEGPLGLARAQGLMVLWLDVSRAWVADDSPDLSGTMVALDKALERAERVAGMFDGGAAPAPDVPAQPSDAEFLDGATGTEVT